MYIFFLVKKVTLWLKFYKSTNIIDTKSPFQDKDMLTAVVYINADILGI